MLPLPVIDDPNVLRNSCALISLSACRIWYSPYHANVDDPRFTAGRTSAAIRLAASDSRRRD